MDPAAGAEQQTSPSDGPVEREKLNGIVANGLLGAGSRPGFVPFPDLLGPGFEGSLGYLRPLHQILHARDD